MLELEYSNVLSVTSTFPLGSLKLQKNSRNTTFTKATSFNKSGKLSSGLRTGKRLVFIPIPKKAMLKKCSDYCTTVLISHASKVMLKILEARV